MSLKWTCSAFSQLTTGELYTILQARQAVFVVEQHCPFPEIDGLDPQCRHLQGRNNDTLVAYCRIVPPGVKFAVPSIGRVLTTAEGRGHGYGIALMEQAVRITAELYPGMDMLVAAQTYLEKFYNRFEFYRTGNNYLEDDIPHIDMLRKYLG
ncbi:MAG TPA: GNAT family N-acetyltransferase [bacterium]|nr:GNAT family N-acetyltransferase [bacterium]HPN43246.1 GNAT family N-acetyltransferase [bacterium]